MSIESIFDPEVGFDVIPRITVERAKAFVAARDPEAREMTCHNSSLCLLTMIAIEDSQGRAKAGRVMSVISLYETESHHEMSYAWRRLTKREMDIVVAFDGLGVAAGTKLYQPTNAEVRAMLAFLWPDSV